MEYVAYVIYSITLVLLIFFNIYIYSALLSTRKGKYPPYVPTVGKRKRTAIEKLSKIMESSKKKLVFMDLGSGIGDVVIPMAIKFHKHEFIGVDWSRLLVWVARKRSVKLKNVKFLCGDMMQQDFSKVDVFYCFIIPQFEKVLSEKIVKEGKKGSFVITNGANFENMELIEEQNGINVYRL